MTDREKLQKHIQLLNEIKSRYPILNDTIKYLEKLEQLNNIFSDSHICEIKARFNEIECDADKCDNCPLAIGEDICLKITFENKWKFQEERDKLKELTYQPTLDECIKEWVKKEWEYIITDDKVLYLWKKENSTTTNTIIYNLKVKELKFNFNFISIELLELLTKTLKAWEGMKDEQV